MTEPQQTAGGQAVGPEDVSGPTAQPDPNHEEHTMADQPQGPTEALNDEPTSPTTESSTEGAATEATESTEATAAVGEQGDQGEAAQAARQDAESTSDADGADPAASADATLAAERLADLQRLQAEYVNYKRRVDRDRALERDNGVHAVLTALLPVLDDIHAARQAGDLESGPFASIADKLERALTTFGLSRFGEAGEAFDPNHHEALMHTEWDADNPALPADADSTTVVQVFQPGYRSETRTVRAARVAVADPS